MNSIFKEFVGQEVKATYHDGEQFKLARGILKETKNGFVKITGRLGTLIISESTIDKMGLQKEGEEG